MHLTNADGIVFSNITVFKTLKILTEKIYMGNKANNDQVLSKQQKSKFFMMYIPVEISARRKITAAQSKVNTQYSMYNKSNS